MGINNLLNTLKPIIQKTHLKHYQNKRIGVDGHCWIHKALYTNIYDTEFNITSSTFLKFLKRRIQLLQKYNIDIYFVIDVLHILNKG